MRAAVHRAVEELVAESPSADLTMPTIAARAGVHPTTVYRRWGSLADLLAEVATSRFSGDIVVPDTGTLEGDLERWTADEHAYQAAQKRLDATVAALARHGITASGHVGSHDPLQAADDGLREFAADEIVFVVHPDAESDWLQRGVVELAEQRYPVPVRRLRPAAKV